MDEKRKGNDAKDPSHGQREKFKANDPDHPGRANLIPWKKGESGNPGGCPKGHGPSLMKSIRELLDEPAEVLKNTKLEGRTVRDVLAMAAVTNAMKGKTGYFREIMVRFHGRVPFRIEQQQVPSDEVTRSDVAAAMIAAGLKAAGDEGGPET